jgi:hypothetical protein
MTQCQAASYISPFTELSYTLISVFIVGVYNSVNQLDNSPETEEKNTWIFQ